MPQNANRPQSIIYLLCIALLGILLYRQVSEAALLKQLNSSTQESMLKYQWQLDEAYEEINVLQKQYEKIPVKMPTKGKVISHFGYRRHPVHKTIRAHRGVDIRSKRHSNIYSAAEGKVFFSGYIRGYGKTVIVDHENGFKTLYAHAQKLFVKKGDLVHPKMVIAKVGSTGTATGPHLHYEVFFEEKQINPLVMIF